MMIVFIWKNGKIHLKMCKTSIFKILFPCFYNFTLPKYRSVSGSYQKGPDPIGFGSGSATLQVGTIFVLICTDVRFPTELRLPTYLS